jgi:hypothetical protein
VTSTIGDFGLRIALSKLIKAARFSAVPKVFLALPVLGAKRRNPATR